MVQQLEGMIEQIINSKFGLVILIFLFITIFFIKDEYLPNRDFYDSGRGWITLGINAGIIIVSIVTIIIIGYFGRKKWLAWRQYQRCLQMKFESCAIEAKELIQKVQNHYYLEQFGGLAKEFNILLQKLKSWENGYLYREAQQLFTRLDREYEQFKQRKSAEEHKKAQELEIFRQNASIVYWAFMEQGSTRTIPQSYKDFSSDVIDRAKRWFEQHQQEEEEKECKRLEEEQMRRRIFRFVSGFRALPTNYANLDAKERRFYDQALKLLNMGKLNEVVDEFRKEEAEQKQKEDPRANERYVQLAGNIDAGKKREQELVGKIFYLASELTQNEQNFLLEHHQYRRYKISNFGENLIPVLYRRKGENEGAYHFCTKHFFARIHPGARVEAIDRRRNEIDILFSNGKRRIAVEIESGTNKPEYVRQKISNLMRVHKTILVVVPRKELKNYRSYHDGKNVFVFTMKKAREMILQWLE